MRKLFNLIFLLFLLCSCYSSRLSTDTLKKIEEEDNNLCMMQGVQYKDKDTREIYWECRLRVINQRIIGEFDGYGYGLLYQREFKRLRSLIKKRIKEQIKIDQAEINTTLEEKEHNYCVMLKDQLTSKIDAYDYFKCRQDIANIRQKSDDYSNQSNEQVLKMLRPSEELAQSKKTKKIMTVEQDCVKYAINANKLKQCQEAMQKANQCIIDTHDKLIQRQIDDKVYCTKLSIERYPDSLAKFDNNTDSISFGPKVEKINIIDLRDKEYNQCLSDREIKFKTYKAFLENECKKENLKLIK